MQRVNWALKYVRLSSCCGRCDWQFAVVDVIGSLESLRQAMSWARENFAGEGVFSERERWFLWAPVALALGVSVYFLLPVEPSLWVGPAAAGLLLSFAFLSRRRTRRTWLTLLFLALAIATCGLAAGQIRSLRVAAPVLQEKTGRRRCAAA
jgi:hypothetical protein